MYIRHKANVFMQNKVCFRSARGVEILCKHFNVLGPIEMVLQFVFLNIKLMVAL